MQRLSGRAITGGSALGTAVVVRWVGGVAHLPPRILEEMALTARKGISDPIEVVLIADDYSRAATLVMPGVRVVAIVAEGGETSGGAPDIPTLVGVDRALERIPDDALILVDADRGLALVDPDGTTVAAFQAERERISPRRRLYIDYAHELARTQDGRPVRVIGVTIDEAGTAASVAAGADGVVLLAGLSSLTEVEDETEQRDMLVRIVAAACGKPVVIAADLDALSARALLEAAVAAEITLALPMDRGPQTLIDARHYLAEVGRELTEAEADWRPVRLAGVVVPAVTEPPGDGLSGVDRLVIDMTAVWDVRAPELLEWLDAWISAAAQMFASAELILPAGALDVIGTAIALGASAVGVAPEEIQPAKEMIRGTDAGMLRAELLES